MFEYEIVEHIGVIGVEKNGWTKEVNVVSWNKRPPKVDIRSWDVTHESMSKGYTLSEEETEALHKVLKGRYEC